jgi:hypothetical protein
MTWDIVDPQHFGFCGLSWSRPPIAQLTAPPGSLLTFFDFCKKCVIGHANELETEIADRGKLQTWLEENVRGSWGYFMPLLLA